MSQAHLRPILLAAEPQRALMEASEALRAGGVVLLPTDTVYGLAVLDPVAEEDLFVLKGRPANRSIAVLVADRSAAESLAEVVPAPLGDLMDRHWPGPLTVVLPRSRRRGAPRLGGDRDTIGVRCPDHPWLRRLLADVGPLATTSANRHGEPTPATAGEVLASLTPTERPHDGPPADPSGRHDGPPADPSGRRADPGEGHQFGPHRGARIALAVDGGPCTAAASTVVAWQHDGLKVLRQGSLEVLAGGLR